jgi:hypothetical protein
LIYANMHAHCDAIVKAEADCVDGAGISRASPVFLHYLHSGQPH